VTFQPVFWSVSALPAAWLEAATPNPSVSQKGQFRVKWRASPAPWRFALATSRPAGGKLIGLTSAHAAEPGP